MAVTKHKAWSASIATALSTELNSLGNGSSSSASAAIDNTSNLDLLVDLVLTVATQGSARGAAAVVEVYLMPAVDGTNYDDAVRNVAELVAVFTLDATTTARQVTRRDIPIPPGLFKLVAYNGTGQPLAASGNTLKYRAHNIETA